MTPNFKEIAFVERKISALEYFFHLLNGIISSSSAPNFEGLYLCNKESL